MSVEPTMDTDVATSAGGTKSRVTYDLLRNWILTGRLEPGRRLDQEWLASTLNVSRMPLRQALQRLAADGLIIDRPHRSAIVAPLSLQLLEDLYASRQAIEGMLAKVSAHKLTPALTETLGKLIELQEEVTESGDFDGYVRHDRAFHLTFYRASGFEQSCALVEKLRDMSDRYIRFFASNNDGAHKSILDHWKILRAAEKGEIDKARELTERHIADGYSALVPIVQRYQQEADEKNTDSQGVK
jgi:DNA-binding GntR family transcriptional regulator